MVRKKRTPGTYLVNVRVLFYSYIVLPIVIFSPYMFSSAKEDAMRIANKYYPQNTSKLDDRELKDFMGEVHKLDPKKQYTRSELEALLDQTTKKQFGKYVDDNPEPLF